MGFGDHADVSLVIYIGLSYLHLLSPACMVMFSGSIMLC